MIYLDNSDASMALLRALEEQQRRNAARSLQTQSESESEAAA